MVFLSERLFHSDVHVPFYTSRYVHEDSVHRKRLLASLEKYEEDYYHATEAGHQTLCDHLRVCMTQAQEQLECIRVGLSNDIDPLYIDI